MAIRNYDKITERELADVVDFKLNYLANNKLSQNITVGGNHGAFKDGEILVTGTRVHDVIQGILNPDFKRPYKFPTLELTGVEENIEVGNIVPISIVPVFTQNDAGPLTRFLLERSVAGGDFVTIFDTDHIELYTEPEVSITDNPNIISFRATVWFEEGNVKYENGQEVEGHIEAGTVSTQLVISGIRKCFYGAESGIKFPVENGTQVRTLPQSTNINGVIPISIPSGTSRITLAYPAYIRDVQKIISKKLGYDIKEVFEKTNIRVEGFNGYNDIYYKVYTYIPDTSYPSDDVYTFYITEESNVEGTTIPQDEQALVSLIEMTDKLVTVEEKMKKAVFMK